MTTTETGPLTVADIEAERGRIMTALDDIIRTAQERPEAERGFTADERTEHDQLVTRFDDLGTELEVARAAQSDAERVSAHEVRRSGINVPNVNTISVPPAVASRSLDELLYATPEVVRAGSATQSGVFHHDANGAVNPVEQCIIRTKDDDGPNTVAPRISEFLPQHQGEIRRFQQLVSDMCLFGLMVDRDAHSSKQGFEVARSHRAFKDQWTEICRAMDTDTSGEGVTWIPTGIGASLHEKVRAMGKVAPLFNRIDLPTNPWKMPIEGADATAYRIAEPTSDTESKPTASTPGTVAATFDAEIFGGRVLFSRSLEADSAIAILPYVTMKLAKAFYIAEEKAILDGDSDGTHQDSDIGASTTDAVTAWDGLRKKGLAQTSSAQTTTTAAKLALVRASMTKWGVNPADLAYIMGVKSYHALLADSNLVTVDKLGPQATILSGQVGSVNGVPVIVSEYVREDINASGVYDGITTTKTYFLCVNRGEWLMGQRMALDIEVDDSIYRETFQRVAVAFMREDFQNIGDAATNEDTAIGYNCTSGS